MNLRASCFLLLLGLGLFAGGCASDRGGHDRSAGASSEDGSKRTSRMSDADVQRLAKAHALYVESLQLDIKGEPGPATEKLDAAFHLDPQDPRLALDLSRRYERATNYDRAVEVLKLAAVKCPSPEAVFAHLSELYFAQGRTNLAAHAGESAVQANPASLLGYQSLYLLRLRTGAPDEAWRVLDQATSVAQAPADFLLDLVELITNFGRQMPARAGDCRTRSVQLLDRANGLQPTNETSLLRIADGYYLFDEFTKALPLYERLLDGGAFSDLFRQNLRARLTAIYLHSGHREKATEQLKSMVADDPFNIQAYLQLSQIALDEKKYSESAEYLNKALSLKPDAEGAYYDVAALQLEADNARGALATLERARNRFPQSFRGEYLAALSFTRLKEYTEALTHFTTAEVVASATDTNRLDHVFFFQMGAASERNGDIPGAEKCFLKSLERSPEFASALNYLGYMWADRGENLERARDMIERAIKQEPENEAYLDSLGWVFYKLGKLPEALNLLEKAARLSKEPDADILDHLGEVYQKLGQVDKAIEAWKKSFAVEPKETVRKKLEAVQAK